MEQLVFYLPLLAILIFSNFIQAITGFGGVILALALGALIYPLSNITFIVIFITLFSSLGMILTLKNKKSLEYFYKSLLPIFLMGVLIGWIMKYLFFVPAGKKIFAVLIMLTVFLIKFRFTNLPKSTSKLFLLMAGMVHIFYASAGPFVMASLNIANAPKEIVRGALAYLWFWMDLFFLINYALINKEQVYPNPLVFLVGIGVVLLSFKLGNFYASKLSQNTFEKLCLGLLFVASIIIFFQ